MSARKEISINTLNLNCVSDRVRSEKNKLEKLRRQRIWHEMTPNNDASSVLDCGGTIDVIINTNMLPRMSRLLGKMVEDFIFNNSTSDARWFPYIGG